MIMSISSIAGNLQPPVSPVVQSSIQSVRNASIEQASASDGANVVATTGLVLGDAKQALAMGYDVQNSWETSASSQTVSDSGSAVSESSTTHYNSDVQQSRVAVNTTMGAYWIVTTDSQEQQTTDFTDSIVAPDGSSSSNAGERTSSSASRTLSYVNPFGHTLTAAQFNADIKQFGVPDSSTQSDTSSSTQGAGDATLSQSEDVMALLGSVPKAGTRQAPSILTALPENGQSASEAVAAELITLTTGVTPADADVNADPVAA